MNTAIPGLLSSKKAVVYITAIIAIAAIIFGGVDPQLAPAYIEKLSDLTMAYLGAQGLADAGRAFAAKKAPAAAPAPASVEDDNSGQESRASDAAATEDDEEETSKSGA